MSGGRAPERRPGWREAVRMLEAVTLLLHPNDPTCSGAAVPVPTATFTTGVSGNGRADAVFDVATVDSFGIRHATHGIIWTISGGGGTYLTTCTAVTLD